MKLEYLFKGLPGHPLHPPLTDATIGTYTVASILALADVTGAIEKNAAIGWWLALIVGLIITAATALTGLIDWIGLPWRSPIWWKATWHMLSMVTATVFFGLAAIFGHDGYNEGNVTTGPFVLTAIGYGMLTLGGWLGGSIVFVHGMRVLNLFEERAERAEGE